MQFHLMSSRAAGASREVWLRSQPSGELGLPAKGALAGKTEVQHQTLIAGGPLPRA